MNINRNSKTVLDDLIVQLWRVFFLLGGQATSGSEGEASKSHLFPAPLPHSPENFASFFGSWKQVKFSSLLDVEERKARAVSWTEGIEFIPSIVFADLDSMMFT